MERKAEITKYIFKEHPRTNFPQIEKENAAELLDKLNDELLEKLFFNISLDTQKKLDKAYLNLKTLLEFIKEVIIENAVFNARNSRLTNSPFGSRYEDEQWLFRYFLAQSIKPLPKWAKDFIKAA